ncbi:MAG: hypothetical protein MK209_06130, partial [Planctomycetes bacterium]|nr:hypothetical protein [Planctomycetota bacterium]
NEPWPNISPEDFSRIQAGLQRTNLGVQVASFRAASDPAIWQDSVRFPVPLLAVYTASPLWEKSHQKAVRELGEDVQLVLWEDAGDNLQWERTEELHVLIENWLRARGR